MARDRGEVFQLLFHFLLAGFNISESEPVRPVPEAFVDALKSHLPPQIWAMIELQRLTGMRPGEGTIMRSCEHRRTRLGYIPSHHKAEYHRHSRQIYLGPRAQEVLRSWLRTDTTAFLFQPKDVMEAMRLVRRQARKTPLSCGHRPGNNVKGLSESVQWLAGNRPRNKNR